MKTKILFIITTILSASTILAQSNTEDEGVIINGVKWATRNVDETGKFVSSPEECGNYYELWEALKACPVGWRLPTKNEFEILVNFSSVWESINNVSGRNFKTELTTLFLPAASFFLGNSDTLYKKAGTNGGYWSSTDHETNVIWAYYLQFDSSDVSLSCSGTGVRFSVRCVAE